MIRVFKKVELKRQYLQKTFAN